MIINIYLIIYSISIIFACSNIKMHENSFFAFWLTVAVILSFFVRMTTGDPNSDIEKYIGIIQGEDFFWAPSYIREFIFWGYARVVNHIIPDRVYFMMAMDVTLFLLLYKSFNLIRDKYFIAIDSKQIRYIYFGALFFFPYYLGMHLHYRQIFACTIFVIALGYAEKNKFIGIIILAISMLVHNIVFVLSPIFFLLRKDITSKFFGIILICVMPILLTLMQDSDNDYIKRHDINYRFTLANWFLAYFILQLLIISYIENYVIKRNTKLLILRLLLIVLILYTISYIFLESALSVERIGLFIFAIIYPFLVYYIEITFTNKFFFRFLYINFSVLPVIFFYNVFV
jgi:hypothetical protein